MHRTSEEEMNEFVKNYNLSLLGEKIWKHYSVLSWVCQIS
jgi:hypothetical protein